MRQFATYVSTMNVGVVFLVLVVFLLLIGFLLRRSARLVPYTGQILVLASILFMAALFTLLTHSFPIAKGKMAAATDAGSIVKLWSALLVPIAILTMIAILKGKEDPDEPFGSLARVGAVVASVVISLLLFNFIGYYISSALFILAVMLLLQERNKVLLAAIPLGWVAFTYLMFARLLYVPLPVGSLFRGMFG